MIKKIILLHNNLIIILLFFIIFIFSINTCKNSYVKENYLFEHIPYDSSGLDFTNIVNETEEFNILQYLYFYNGGGVAIGDINNDGLEDIFLTSNQGPDKLYLNLGNLKFKDITIESGINHPAGWSTGVNIIDINGDGWRDIYICRLGLYKLYKNDYNRVYINDGTGHFSEKSNELGLHFSGFSTHCAFFDIDRDGDLDAYLLNHSVKDASHFKPSAIRNTYDSLAGDILYENINGEFHNISRKAGIYQSSIGYGLGISVADYNNDGWQDIYICNDFHENDYLYLNQGNGTFKEVCQESFGHTSNFSMGVDSDDIDDDGLVDIFSVDMKPDEELIYKNSGGWENLQIYNFKRSYGYHHQQPKNAFQWNRGISSNGMPFFSEISGLLGIDATDWSWSPIIADFDLDGNKDIFITNGIKRRPNDLDFVAFISNEAESKGKSDKKLIQSMPEGSQANRFYKNNGNLNFSLEKWSEESPSLSNGAAVADLDNDGDLDLIINNFNDRVSLFKNNTNPKVYTTISLKNENKNTDGIGAKVTIYSDKIAQHFLIKSVQGFQSSGNKKIIIASRSIDSLKIIWPEGKIQTTGKLNTGQLHTILKDQTTQLFINKPIISNFDLKHCVELKHIEDNYNDQLKESWIPYLLSSMGPKIAASKSFAGYMTKSKNSNGLFFDYLTCDNTYELDKGISKATADENNACIFDANGDNIEDLYLCLGGNEMKTGNRMLSDHLYLGKKDGTFISSQNFLPDAPFNTSVARHCDFDKDGDFDLFVGVQSDPGIFGKSQKSYLLINQNNSNFLQESIDLQEMVYDAVWADIDKNGYEDLIVCGHWMPITIFYNQNGKFRKEIIKDSEGLWFTLLVADINKDGFMDMLAGNFGNNHSLKCSTLEPLLLYINDFDNNGSSESLLTYNKRNKRYLFPNKDMFVSQLPSKKKFFLKNKDYAGKSLIEIFSKEELTSCQFKECKTTSSSIFFGSKMPNIWTRSELPKELQLAPVRSIIQIENQTFIFGGNFFDVDPNIGRQDALPLSGYTYSLTQNKWLKAPLNLPLFRDQVSSLKIIDNSLFIGCNNSVAKKLVLNKKILQIKNSITNI